MRKFYVAYIAYYTDDQTVVTTTIELDSGEKANAATFQSKINEKRLDGWDIPFCGSIGSDYDVVSWSLIEE